jgi:hypothetical protein
MRSRLGAYGARTGGRTERARDADAEKAAAIHEVGRYGSKSRAIARVIWDCPESDGGSSRRVHRSSIGERETSRNDGRVLPLKNHVLGIRRRQGLARDGGETLLNTVGKAGSRVRLMGGH